MRLLDERTPAHVDDLSLRAQIPAQVALRKLADQAIAGRDAVVVGGTGLYIRALLQALDSMA